MTWRRSNSYTQYVAEAAWKAYQIHGGQLGIVQNLAQYAEADVEGQLAFNQYHTVTFTSVNTTRLRVVLNSTSTSSVGLLEVKAFTI